MLQMISVIGMAIADFMVIAFELMRAGCSSDFPLHVGDDVMGQGTESLVARRDSLSVSSQARNHRIFCDDAQALARA